MSKLTREDMLEVLTPKIDKALELINKDDKGVLVVDTLTLLTPKVEAGDVGSMLELIMLITGIQLWGDKNA